MTKDKVKLKREKKILSKIFDISNISKQTNTC